MATRRTRRACIVTHNELAVEVRARREAEALLSDGWSLDIVCMRAAGEPFRENWNGATIHRLPVRRHRGSGIAVYLLEYAAFFVMATGYISWLSLRRQYDVIQAHNVPDALVFTAILPRLLGARVVLDVRDPLPDLYLSKFGPGWAVKLAGWVEAGSAAFADHVLTPGEPSRQRMVGRGVPAEKISNVLNTADPRLFAPVVRAAAADRFTLVYHGGLFERYGLDVAIRAVHQLRRELPGLRLRIAGYGEEEAALRQLVADLDVGDRVSFEGWIDPEQIRSFVAEADLGVVPYRQDTFTDLIYPTKAFEYIAMGVPVVMSRLSGVANLFRDVPDLFVQPGDVDDLAERIISLHRDRSRLDRLNGAAQRAYRPHRWEDQRRAYLELIRRLTGRHGDHPVPRPVAGAVALDTAEG